VSAFGTLMTLVPQSIVIAIVTRPIEG